MDTAELQRLPIFAGLDQAQLAQLAQVGQQRVVEPGEELWTEGDPADIWWVLVEGSISLAKRVGSEQSVVGAMTQPGQWAGGFAAWDPGARCFATGRAVETSRVLTVPAAELARLGDQWFAFGVHFIRGLVDTVRRVESTARQREALVALGTLAAGLAHEINNPAAAATRAVDSLTTTSEALVSSLATLAGTCITADQFAELAQLRREVRAPEPGGTLSPSPTSRTTSRTGWATTGSSASGSSPRSWRPAGSTPRGATAWRPSSARSGSPRASSGWSTPRRWTPCSPR